MTGHKIILVYQDASNYIVITEEQGKTRTPYVDSERQTLFVRISQASP